MPDNFWSMIVSILVKYSIPQLHPYLYWNVSICEASQTQIAIPDPKQRNPDEVEGVIKRAAVNSDGAQCVKFGVFGDS